MWVSTRKPICSFNYFSSFEIPVILRGWYSEGKAFLVINVFIAFNNNNANSM